MEVQQVIPPGQVWAIAIAASAGGIPALTTVLKALPRNLPAIILVVQHLDRSRAHSYLPEILARRVALHVEQARDGTLMCESCVYVAPPNRHLVVRSGGRIGLSDEPAVHFVRPAADVLFPSVAARFGAQAIAVVLSGSGYDGGAGAAAIHQAGGIVIAQNEATAQHFGMPSSAIATGPADYVLPIEQIPQLLMKLISPHGQN